MFSTLSFSLSRKEGVWNRLFICGLRSSELICINLILCILFALIYEIQIILSLNYIMNIEIIGNLMLIFIFIMSTTIVCYLLGFFIAILLDNVVGTTYLATSLIIINYMTSGILWYDKFLINLHFLSSSQFFRPLEGAHLIMRFIFQYNPISLAIEGMRIVVLKGATVIDPIVYEKLILLGFSMTLMIILNYILLYYKRFSRVI